MVEAEFAARKAPALGLEAPETRLVLARALQSQRKFDEAEKAFSDAIARRPTYVDAHRDLAQLVWMRTGQVSLALSRLERALRAAPGEAGLHLVRSTVLEFAGDFEGALAAAAAGLEHAPGQRDLLRQAAQLSARLGNADRALILAGQAAQGGTEGSAERIAWCEALLAAKQHYWQSGLHRPPCRSHGFRWITGITTRIASSYLITALESIHEGIGGETRQIMQSTQLVPPHILLSSLMNALGKATEPYALVLDDYQVITEHAVHEAVAYLLDHIPSRMHIVLATRADPPLQLGRLRADDQLLEFRTRDLRFIPEEATEFLNTVMNLGLADEDIETLETRTEGWVAGLKMAALSLRGHENVSEFIRAFSGSHRYVLDYLVEEVYDQV